eukprot:4346139-Pleurochrysis_carterae.AAC.1
MARRNSTAFKLSMMNGGGWAPRVQLASKHRGAPFETSTATYNRSQRLGKDLDCITIHVWLADTLHKS